MPKTAFKLPPWLSWSPLLKDPRKPINQLHGHLPLLRLLCLAFAAGRTTLRDVEDFSTDLALSVRKALGLRGPVSDSTLYRLLAKHSPTGLRESLQDQVRNWLNRGLITHDRFTLRVVSIDGKTFFSSQTRSVDGARVSVAHDVVTSSLMALRAVLSSSLVTPLLDMEFFGEKEGEASAFRKLFPRLLEALGACFDMVTADSGIGCRENAKMVNDAKKGYLFSLKGIQKLVEDAALALFEQAPGPTLFMSKERRDGGWMIRELHAVPVDERSGEAFAGAREFWRVIQRLVVADKVINEDARLFVTNRSVCELGAEEAMGLVRLHWAIENNHNWTMDVPMMEDDRQPCQTSKESLEVVCWLRVMGYNIASLQRTKATRKDRKPQTWRRTMERLRDFLCFASAEIQSVIG